MNTFFRLTALTAALLAAHAAQADNTIAATTLGVTNAGDISNGTSAAAPSTVDAGGATLGNSVSVSVSSSGAVASISASSQDLTSGSIGQTTYGGVTTLSQNTSDANTTNVTTYGSVTVGDLEGVSSSASIGATGAVSSVSFSSSNSQTDAPAGVTFDGANTLVSINGGTAGVGVADLVGAVPDLSSAAADGQGSVVSVSGDLTTGALTGSGASASASATGAVASISVKSVADANPFVDNIVVGADGNNLASLNYNAVQNTSSVTVGGDLAQGTSASVGATGAVASVGFSFTGQP